MYKAWLIHSKRDPGELREDFQIFQDFSRTVQQAALTEDPPSLETSKRREKESPTMAIAEKIDVTYSSLKWHVAKSIALSAELLAASCSVCTDPLDLRHSVFLTCPSEGCRAVSHLSCLAKRWTPNQQPDGFLLPMSGSCLQCGKENQWVDLVKELSIRGRGEKHIARLIEAPRMRKSRMTKALSNDADAEQDNDGPVVNVSVRLEKAMEEIDILTGDPEDDPLPDDWQELVDEDDDDSSVTSTESRVSSRHASPVNSKKQRRKLEVVIEDSEWDSAELLD